MARIYSVAGAQRLPSFLSQRISFVAVLSLVPLATAAACAAIVQEYLASPLDATGRLAAAVLLAGLTFVQIALLSHAAFNWVGMLQSRLPWSDFAKGMLVFAVGILALAFCFGEHHGGRFVLLVGSAAIGALVLVPIAAPSTTLDFWRRLSMRRWVRKSAAAVYSTIVGLVGVELVLQGLALLPARGVKEGDRYLLQASLIRPDSLISLPASFSPAGWTDDNSTATRVAIVGNAKVFDTAENSLPNEPVTTHANDTSFQQFGAGLNDVSRKWEHVRKSLVASKPDAVIAVVSVGHDFVEKAGTSWLDWRNLQLVRYAARISGHSIAPSSTAGTEPKAFERLAVCRSPLSAEMRLVWKETGSRLAQLTAVCRDQDLPLAVIVVPAKFQLSCPTRDAMLHQAGYERSSLDLELPQRRLAALAHAQQIPVVDLLPELRTTSDSIYERDSDKLSARGQEFVRRAVQNWIASNVPDKEMLLAATRSPAAN